MEIEILIHQVRVSIEKDLILSFLKSHSSEFVDILDIRNIVFNQGYPFENVRQYSEELHKDELIKIERNNPSKIKFNNPVVYFSNAQNIRNIFTSENIKFSASTVTEVRNKDLILYYLKYKNLRNQSIVSDLPEILDLFPFIAEQKIEYYLEDLRNKGFIKPMDNNIDVFRYSYKSDAFIEKGGFTIEYLKSEINNAELKRITEEKKLSPSEILRKQKTEKRKEYIDTIKTDLFYYFLKSLIPAILIIAFTFYILIRFNIITQEKAINILIGIIEFIK